MNERSSSVVTKRSFNVVKLHLNRFNEVAIPCHVDLLRKHKLNIVKFQELGDWKRVNQEQINATRLIKQLKSLLHEVEALRLQVHECDLQKFDKYIAFSKQTALDIINEYTDIKIYHAGSDDHLAESNYNYGTETIGNVQDELQTLEVDIIESNERLKAYNELQDEIHELTDLYQSFSRVVQDQGESVNAVENNVSSVKENVIKGNTLLAKAEKYKTAAFPVAGAVIGTCIAGPIGLFVGAKIGSVITLGGMALGFTGGRILKKVNDEKYEACCAVELNTLQSDLPNRQTPS